MPPPAKRGGKPPKGGTPNIANPFFRFCAFVNFEPNWWGASVRFENAKLCSKISRPNKRKNRGRTRRSCARKQRRTGGDSQRSRSRRSTDQTSRIFAQIRCLKLARRKIRQHLRKALWSKARLPLELFGRRGARVKVAEKEAEIRAKRFGKSRKIACGGSSLKIRRNDCDDLKAPIYRRNAGADDGKL